MKDRKNYDIKLLALDLDGTLFNHEGIITEACIRAIQYAIDKGDWVVLEAADYVTSTNEEDGVAKAIYQFI